MCHNFRLCAQSSCCSSSHQRYTLTGRFRIQRSRVSSLLHLQDPLDPGDDLVRTRIRRFIQINVSRFNVLLDVAIQRRSAERQRRIVVRPDVQLVEVLEEQRPLGCLQFGDLVGGFDEEVAGLLDFAQVVDWLLFDFLRFALLFVRG